MTAQPPSLTDSAQNLLAETAWLRGLIAHLVRDSHERDDIAQDIGVLALDRAPAQVRSLRGWLTAVVRSVAGRRRQRAALQRLSEQRAARAEAEPSAHDVVVRVEAHRRVVETVIALEEPYRSVVLLRFFEGRKPAAIAAALGCPVATVHTRLNRGLQLLRTRLQRAFGGRHDWALICGVPGLWRAPLPATAVTQGTIVMGMHKKMLAVVGAALVVGVGVLLSHGSGEEPAASGSAAAAALTSPTTAPVVATAPERVETSAARTAIDAPPVEVVPEPDSPVRPVAGQVVAIVVDAQGRLLAGAQVWRAVKRQPKAPDEQTAKLQDLLVSAVSAGERGSPWRVLLAGDDQNPNAAIELSVVQTSSAETKPDDAKPGEANAQSGFQLLLSGSDGKAAFLSGLPIRFLSGDRGWGDWDRSAVYDLESIGRTGRDGRCRFTAEGTVTLVATTAGTSSGLVVFELPAQGAEVVLLVLPTCGVSGVVVDAVGKPLEGATVTAQPSGEVFPRPRLTTATTDRDGRFSLALDALGDFEITATAASSESERLHFKATPAAAVDVRVRMLGAVSVAGALLAANGAPIGDSRVHVARLDPDPQADPRVRPFETSVTTDAQGNFQVLLPSAGEYLFAANPDGHAPAPAQSLTLMLGAAPPRLRVVCPPSVAMHGNVRWGDGQAAVGAQVVATPIVDPMSRVSSLPADVARAVSGDPRSVDVQADGSYRIDGLAEHLRYRLSCRPDAQSAVRERRDQLAPSLQDFTFDRTQVRGASVRVLVQPSNGAQVDNVNVIVARRDEKGVWHKAEGRDVALDAQGQATIDGLLPGATTAIEVRCAGWGRCRSEPFVAGGVADLVFRPQPSGRLEVSVIDPSGRPCLGARVVLREPAPEGLRREDSVRTTDVLGQSVWDSVSVLPWTVLAEWGGLRAAPQPVVIESGGTVRVELKLTR